MTSVIKGHGATIIVISSTSVGDNFDWSCIEVLPVVSRGVVLTFVSLGKIIWYCSN